MSGRQTGAKYGLRNKLRRGRSNADEASHIQRIPGFARAAPGCRYPPLSPCVSSPSAILLTARYPFPRHAPLTRPGGPPVKQLIAYLLDHAILDFSGDLTLDMSRDFLRGDDSPAARALLAKIDQEGGVDDMVVTLADCLQEYLRTGLSDNVVHDQIKLYAESRGTEGLPEAARITDDAPPWHR